MPRPAAPGAVSAYDYEYERNGVSSLFMLFAPLDGWRRDRGQRASHEGGLGARGKEAGR